MVNTNKIKGRAVELGLKGGELAKLVGISQSYLNQKINNRRPMTLEQAEKLSKVLKINNEDFTSYFFNNVVA